MHSIGKIFDVLSVIIICACFMVDIIFLDDTVRETIWILLIEILRVTYLLLAAVISERYYWGKKEGSVFNQPCFGKVKSVSYDAVEYFTIERAEQKNFSACSGCRGYLIILCWYILGAGQPDVSSDHKFLSIYVIGVYL